MYWKLGRNEYDSLPGVHTKRKMKNLVYNGIITVILAFDINKTVGWCSLMQREDFKELENSGILRRTDNKFIHSIVRFFIDKK